jgi:hypothetical protein
MVAEIGEGGVVRLLKGNIVSGEAPGVVSFLNPVTGDHGRSYCRPMIMDAWGQMMKRPVYEEGNSSTSQGIFTH